MKMLFYFLAKRKDRGFTERSSKVLEGMQFLSTLKNIFIGAVGLCMLARVVQQ